MKSIQESGTETTTIMHRAVRWAWTFVVIGFSVASVGITVACFTKGGFSLSGLSELGSYLQGSVASIWSLAGLLFIYATFLAQREQMARQETELADQRKQFEAERIDQQKQIESQRQQFEAQQESIKHQNFESSFFEMLSLQNQIVSQLRGRDEANNKEVVGRECFEVWYNVFRRDLRAVTMRPDGANDESQATASARYLIFYQPKQGMLGHYFRNLYHVFRFIADNSDLPKERKNEYASLVRAQLSAYELALLFYNGVTPFPPEPTNKFKPLIETFCLLKNLDRTLLVWPSHEKTFYKEGALKKASEPKLE
jgi:hypothetical protein